MSSLIIESPHRQGMVRRIFQGGITLFFWVLWIYLMLPLAAPLMAAAGVENLLFISAEPVNYLKFLFPILLFIGVVMLSMELWVIYNIFLHRRNNRQEPLSIVYQSQLASHFGVSPHLLAGWHRSEQMIIRLTEYGKVYDVEVKKPSVAKPRSRRTVRSQMKNCMKRWNRSELYQKGRVDNRSRLNGVSP